MAATYTGDNAQGVARQLIDKYFRTVEYPYTRHHIDSYDQFLKKDLPAIIQSHNPVLLLKDLINPADNTYRYKVQIYIGGEKGTEIEIGSPTVNLQNTDEVRMLFPNEARLRNITYASTVYVNITVKIEYNEIENGILRTIDLSPPANTFQNHPIFKIPIMLHSRYCALNGKPKEFLRQAGECPYDHGGYFVIEGSEKVLVTRQEPAFNTLYITPQERDPKIRIFSSITCLNAQTRTVKRVTFYYISRRFNKPNPLQAPISEDAIQVGLPFVRKPIPLFVLFRALGFQSDEEILHLIYPDFEAPEAKLMLPKLHASIIDAHPFLNTYTSIQYIKTLTKGFSEVHVLDIIRNQMFVHMANDPKTQALFLAECVRKILRVNEGFDKGTDRDDIRNQRCLTSGFLIQMLFSNAYNVWKKAFTLAIDREYEANKRALYKGENFKNIFVPGSAGKIFAQGLLTESIMRGFKGKWGTGMGEENAGVLQVLSRLSYCDFISHCRRVILKFDTTMKLTGPRKLHPSQYGYFCTNETPSGGSIGIAKNLSVLTAISTATETPAFFAWLRTKGRVYQVEDITDEQRIVFIPVYINNGMFGFTAKPHLLEQVLKTFKRTGCLPYSVSVTFSIRERKVQIFLDEGRPLRPLVWLSNAEGIEPVVPFDKLLALKTWRNLVMGTLPIRQEAGLDATDFVDPYADEPTKMLESYPESLARYTGGIEYVDPYEHNEAYIANYPEYIKPETTHIEVHPSTIMSIMTSVIPFAHHNQSPRNQLSCSQSKQGISYYATNWQNRFDNTAHMLCYGEAPLSRTIYSNYLGEGKMPYGMNVVLAIACWSGYNQEDGIVMNYDALQRGLFRTIAYRSYEAFEEDDEMAKVKTRFGNPANIASWKDLKPGLDYSKLDERGFIREGEYCDENTVIIGAYMTSELGTIKDASVTPQVWTRGRVEKIAILVNNFGLRLIKIRVVQDRIPEIGDKFSNRHGQKGTIGAMLRAHDLPHTRDGIVPDMIMNPHAIPSRMTIAQNLEQLLGKTAGLDGAIGDGTPFMNDGSPEEQIGGLLEKMGYEKYGNEILYNGATGGQIPAIIFIGPVYGMRLKHMVEDKWQARSQGRREQRTHQPTGGRGQQGGLKIGEMDRDAVIGHSISAFFRESFMKRSDGAKIAVCTSCGTIPIYNARMGIAVCSLCSGPVRYIGDRSTNLELLPPLGNSGPKIVNVEIPYATKVLQQELETYMNIGMRYITTSGTNALKPFELSATSTEVITELPRLILQTAHVPDIITEEEEPSISLADLDAMGADVGALNAAFTQEQLAQKQIEKQIEQQNEIIMPGEEALTEFEDDETFVPPLQNSQPFAQQPLQNSQPFAQQPLQNLQPLAQQQPLVQQQQPLQNLPLLAQESPVDSEPPVIMDSALPNGPKTIIVDTSAPAMESDGLSSSAARAAINRQSRPLRQNFGNQASVNRPAFVPGRTEGNGEEAVTLRSSAPVFVNKLQ